VLPLVSDKYTNKIFKKKKEYSSLLFKKKKKKGKMITGGCKFDVIFSFNVS